jgi:putative heme degradation protein
MESAINLRSPLRLVRPEASPKSVGHAPMALPLQPDWQRLLRDLTSFGLVRVRVANPWASLNCIGDPWYVDSEGHAGGLRGPGLYLAGLVDRWAAASIGNDRPGDLFDQLTVSDHAGRELFRVTLTEDSAYTGFHALLVRQWARRGAPGGMPDTRAVSADEQAALQACCSAWLGGEPRHCWYGLTGPQPPGTAVDPTLVAPFLETMVDQGCPLRVLLGNQGVIRRHDDSYFDMRQSHDKLTLRSSTSAFELDGSGLAAARVVGSGEGTEASRIHLYDDRQRCVATLGLAAGAGSGDRGLWQAMIRALVD